MAPTQPPIRQPHRRGLTPVQIERAREMRRWGHRTCEIARRLGVTGQAVSPYVRDVKPE